MQYGLSKITGTPRLLDKLNLWKTKRCRNKYVAQGDQSFFSFFWIYEAKRSRSFFSFLCSRSILS